MPFDWFTQRKGGAFLTGSENVPLFMQEGERFDHWGKTTRSVVLTFHLFSVHTGP